MTINWLTAENLADSWPKWQIRKIFMSRKFRIIQYAFFTSWHWLQVLEQQVQILLNAPTSLLTRTTCDGTSLTNCFGADCWSDPTIVLVNKKSHMTWDSIWCTVRASVDVGIYHAYSTYLKYPLTIGSGRVPDPFMSWLICLSSVTAQCVIIAQLSAYKSTAQVTAIDEGVFLWTQ